MVFRFIYMNFCCCAAVHGTTTTGAFDEYVCVCSSGSNELYYTMTAAMIIIKQTHTVCAEKLRGKCLLMK